jgi:hypothetical protein
MNSLINLSSRRLSHALFQGISGAAGGQWHKFEETLKVVHV